MITRGFYIGEIIDEFASISAQVKMRNALGFTDLSVYCEDFFRDVLNQLLGINLKNLNEERSNEPGLDLGDEAARLAVQVTSSATSQKLADTLSKITAAQQKRYDKFIVLAIAKTQKKYTYDATRAAALSFSDKNVWDMDALARKALALDLGRLEGLHRLVRANVARVKVELEIPDASGKYPTNGYDQWEPRVKPKIGDGLSFSKFAAKRAKVTLEDIEPETIAEALKTLGMSLSRLPRVTREFLVALLERREEGKSRRFKESDGWSCHLLYSKVEREFRGSDLTGELDILDHADFATINGEDRHYDGPAEIGVRLSDDPDLAGNFLEFVEAKKLDLRRVIGEIDLSAF